MAWNVDVGLWSVTLRPIVTKDFLRWCHPPSGMSCFPSIRLKRCLSWYYSSSKNPSFLPPSLHLSVPCWIQIVCANGEAAEESTLPYFQEAVQAFLAKSGVAVCQWLAFWPAFCVPVWSSLHLVWTHQWNSHFYFNVSPIIQKSPAMTLLEKHVLHKFLLC